MKTCFQLLRLARILYVTCFAIILSREQITNEPRHVISNNVAFGPSVDLDEPVQPPVKPSNSKLCSVSSLTVIEHLSD